MDEKEIIPKFKLGVEFNENIYDVINFSDIKDIEKNPYLDHLVINTYTTLKGFKSGEVVMPDEIDLPPEEIKRLTEDNKDLKKKGLGYAKRQTKQSASFTIVYNNPHLNFRDLSGCALKIIHLIWEKKLAIGSDFVVLDVNECCVELSVTRPTVVKAFVELVRNKVLHKRNDYNWWINPNYFYAGNRLKINTK